MVAQPHILSQPFLSAPAPSVTHVPRTVAGIDAMPKMQRTLAAAAVASGAEAVAYYARGADNQFHLSQHLDIYPTKTTEFSETTYYHVPGDDDVRVGAARHIAVQDALGQMQGIVVLQPPRDGFGRVQTLAEEADADDLHDSLAQRNAKYTMAAHIIEHSKNELMGLAQGFTAKVDPLKEKQKYIQQMHDDFLNILGADGSQAQHVKGVSDLMMLATDVINAEKPIIGETQGALLADLTVLHDVGKLQAGTGFLNKKWRDKSEGEKQAREHYFMGLNHNHPLFTRLILGAYPTDALVTAGHHHGLLRYTDEQLKKGLGDDYAQYKILNDNVAFDKLPVLSKFMRVCDVTEAMTGKGNKPVAQAILELAKMAGYDREAGTVNKTIAHDCTTIEPDVLCMLIDGGLFTAYGRQRTGAQDGWKDPNGAAKYDEEAVQKASAEVLAAFGWEKSKATSLRAQVEQSDFVQQNRSTGRTR